MPSSLQEQRECILFEWNRGVPDQAKLNQMLLTFIEDMASYYRNGGRGCALGENGSKCNPKWEPVPLCWYCAGGKDIQPLLDAIPDPGPRDEKEGDEMAKSKSNPVDDPPVEDIRIRMSGINHCRLRAAYAMHETSESDPSPEEWENVAALGVAAEAIMVSRLEKEGYTVTHTGDQQDEVSFRSDKFPWLMFVGHPDGYLERNGTKGLLEMKCPKDSKWEAWLHQPAAESNPDYYAQVMLYLHATGLDRVRFEVMNRNDGRRFHEVLPSDPAYVAALIKRWEAVATTLSKGELPAPDHPLKDHWECGVCRWKSICPSGGTEDE